MQFRKDVRSNFRQPGVEHNSGSVYVRCNFVKSTESTDDRTSDIWTYDEYFMSEDEYNDVQVGRFSEWTDTLCSVRRAYLYRIADDHIAKYTTDVPDETKRNLWVNYKAAVRATQDQPGYPMDVTYPDFPE